VSLPVLVVSGFLGAGKTTFINRLLISAEGRRIAAIVNDFGAINIDAELIAERSETVLDLSNGCICCSLQGDLLRTLKLITSRGDLPDLVVIEASGIADPQGIVAALMDPALWGSVLLDAVLTVIDAEDCAATPTRMEDPIWRAQVDSADLLVLTKTASTDTAPLKERLDEIGRAPVLLSDDQPLRADLLLGTGAGDRPRPELRPALGDDRFVSLEVESAEPARLPVFQEAIEQIAPSLLRAKGIMTFGEMPGRTLLFQMTGRRATFVPHEKEASGCRLVLIGERSDFDTETAARLLARALPGMVLLSVPHCT
jgi:G3E family GTPase